MNFYFFPRKTFNKTTIAVLVFTLVMAFYYREMLLNLSTAKCLEPYRDGIKTHLNAAWHARYGHSVTWFEGMNYPYQEHIMAATELPGVAILLKMAVPGLSDHVFGVVHLLLWISIVLCPVFLFLIFNRLKLPACYAIPVSLGLTFLAPQNMRLMPHTGLAPLFVLPAVIYGLLLFEKGSHRKATGLIFATIVISSFCHFYFFAITVFTVTGFLFFYMFQSFSWQRLKLVAMHYGIMAGLPILFFYAWMVIGDTVTDRCARPWGFLVFKTIWESVFLSLEMPLWRWVNDHLIKIETTDFEGWSYVGIAAGVFIILVFFRWVGRFFKKPVFDFVPADDWQFYYSLLWTGVALALFSGSQPFAIEGLEFLLDYAGPVRQFRSTGRFAWVFYFAINILAFTGFFYLLKNWRRKLAGSVFLTLLLGLLFYEAFIFSKSQWNYAPNQLRQVETLLPGHRFTDLPGIDFGRYQAIVPIPYYNVGSNNFGATGGALTVQQSLILSYQTGLPVTGAMLTRSSRRQAYDQLQLVTEPYRRPKVFEDYKNSKPLLLLVTYPMSRQDSISYGHLIQESRLLHQTVQWSLYEMELASFDRRIEKQKAAVQQTIEKNVLHDVEPFLSTDSVKNFIYHDFDELRSDKTYRGKGALKGSSLRENELFSGQLPAAVEGQDYRLLSWVYVDEDLLSSIYIRFQEKDRSGNKLTERFFIVSNQIVVYDPNGWALIECPFQLQSGDHSITVDFYWTERDDQPFYFDELLIKPANTHLYGKSARYVWHDDRFYE
jgi:hypothetical protein